LASALGDATKMAHRAEAEAAEAEKAARDAVKDATDHSKDAADRWHKVQLLDQRLADGETKIADLESDHQHDLSQLEATLTTIGVPEVPTPEEVDSAARLAEQSERLAAVAGALEQLAARAAQASEAIVAAESAITALGDVRYDPAAHKEAVAALKAAQEAAAEVRRIDRELQGRGGYETTRDAATQELACLAVKRREAETARAAIGFDEHALSAARDAEALASEAVQIARERLTTARDELRDAQSERARVLADRERLQQLAAEAERCGREADELTRMYEEFSRFDRFVAEQISPLLATITERLLRDVTDGKYDHVTFDEDYGIQVFDGDQCFPLEGFSGGERDVVALCARLAMSELIGSAATRPPRFLVLDEVFGSLDSDRRAQLLTTLGTLAASAHVQQMFIISHVDDVQQSPVMNEAWTIEERDGVSRVVRHGAPLTAG
jgi:exonuclease SbcC